jgi:DNA-binding NtrC family response regulator
VFDAWYPSRSLLKRIRDSGWYFVCRLKKNRRFNGHQATRRLERLLITRALARSQGNKAEAARLLQIRRQHLYAKLKELGIE